MGGKMGRSEKSTLALADSTRYISQSLSLKIGGFSNARDRKAPYGSTVVPNGRSLSKISLIILG